MKKEMEGQEKRLSEEPDSGVITDTDPSTVDSDLSAASSKDENSNPKDKKNVKDKSSVSGTQLLDLPDTLIQRILNFIPLQGKGKAVKTGKVCSPADAARASKDNGGVSVTCKRLHRLSCQRKKKGKVKSDVSCVNLPIRSLEIPIGQEQLRLTYGDANPSEKWTNCYSSIDKIISSSPWLEHLSIKEYYNSVHTTHLITLSLQTASIYCSDKNQLQTLKIGSCEAEQPPPNISSRQKQEPQEGAAVLLGRHPGSIDWTSFSRFCRMCGHNILTLELNNINFRDILPRNLQDNKGAREEAREEVKKAFGSLKKLQNLTLTLSKGEKGNNDCVMNITPHIMACSVMWKSLRVLKLSLANFLECEAHHRMITDALSSCYELQELIIRFAEQLSARDMDVISRLPRLKRLGISNAIKLKSADFVNAFAETRTRFSSLSSLSLVLCSGIDARSLEAILGSERKEEEGRNLQDLDIYADGLEDDVIHEIQQEKGPHSHLLHLKKLCAKYFAVNITLVGATPGALFKLSNLEKLDNHETYDDKSNLWTKLRQLRCNPETIPKSDEFVVANETNEMTLPPPSPPPEYSNFTVMDSQISCQIKSVPTVVLSDPSSLKCR